MGGKAQRANSRVQARALVIIALAAATVTGCSHEESSKKEPVAATDHALAQAPEKGIPAQPVASVTAPVSVASAAVASPAAPAADSPAPTATGAQSTATGAQSSATTSPQPAATGPQIYSIATSPSVVHAGDAVIWDVRTTRNIVTVTAHVSAYTIPLHRTAPGRFALNFTVPSNVPGIFHGTYNLDVTARTGTGASATRTVSMSFQ